MRAAAAIDYDRRQETFSVHELPPLRIRPIKEISLLAIARLCLGEFSRLLEM